MLWNTLVIISTLTVSTGSMDDVRLYLNRGHNDDARELLQEQVNQDPRDIESLLALALLEMEEEHYQEAVTYLEQVLALDPYDDDSRLELTEALWRMAAKDKARKEISALLTRHPEWPAALSLQSTITADTPLPSPPSLWRPLVRGSLSTGFDSNPRLDNTLDNTALGRISSGDASLIGSVSLAAGVQHMGRTQPFSLVAHLRTQQSLGEFDTFKNIMPTTLGLTALGRAYLGPFRSELHIHYEELFTNMFSTHYHRLIRATASSSYRLTRNNTLQISTGADVRHVRDQSPDVTTRFSLRDTLSMGRFSLSVDARIRYNLAKYDAQTVNATTLEIGFLEASSVIYTEYRFQAPFTIFALTDFAIREIPEVLDETTLFVQGGIVWNLSFCDIHSEYAYTRNRSNNEVQRDYNRHQLTAGVRFWYD